MTIKWDIPPIGLFLVEEDMNKRELMNTLRLEVNHTKSYSVNNKSIVGMNEEHIEEIKIDAYAYDSASPDSYEKKIATIVIDKIESSFGMFAKENYDMAEFMDGYGSDEGMIALFLGLYSGDTGFPNDKNKRLYNKMLDILSTCDLHYIRKFKVESKYRKLGIGKRILNKLPFILQDINFRENSVIVLRAVPFEIDEDENEKLFKEYEKKLFRFYENCGFECIYDNVFLRVD